MHSVRWPIRDALAKSLVRSRPLVVLDVLAEHVIQVPTPHYQKVIERLSADARDPALREGIRPRRSIRQVQDSQAFTAKDVVKCDWELGIPIAKQKPHLSPLFLQLPDQVAGLLNHPPRRGMAGAARVMNPPTADLQEEQHVQPLQPGCFHGKEVRGQQLLGMLSEELPPGGPTAQRAVVTALLALAVPFAITYIGRRLGGLKGLPAPDELTKNPAASRIP